MPLQCINLMLAEKFKSDSRQELILRVISRDLTGIVRSLGNDKIDDLGKILDKIDNPVKELTEDEIIAKIEKTFKGKISR